jgi:actin-related protein
MKVSELLTKGYNIRHTLKKNNIGGKTHTNYLLNLIRESNSHIKTSITVDFIEELKEKFCFVELKSQESGSVISTQQHDFELPDSTIISLTNERWKCPELLFDPCSTVENESPIQTLVHECIKPVDNELRKVLFENIHIAGGNTLFEGFEERLRSEISLKNKAKVQVIAPMERMYSTWIGGSILTCISSFNDNWILRQDYSEIGPNISHRMGHLF